MKWAFKLLLREQPLLVKKRKKKAYFNSKKLLQLIRIFMQNSIPFFFAVSRVFWYKIWEFVVLSQRQTKLPLRICYLSKELCHCYNCSVFIPVLSLCRQCFPRNETLTHLVSLYLRTIKAYLWCLWQHYLLGTLIQYCKAGKGESLLVSSTADAEQKNTCKKTMQKNHELTFLLPKRKLRNNWN